MLIRLCHEDVWLADGAIGVEWQSIAFMLAWIIYPIELGEQPTAEQVELEARVFALVLGLYKQTHV